MKKSIRFSFKVFFLMASMFIIAGCQNKPCRDIRSQKAASDTAVTNVKPHAISPAPVQGSSMLKVKVYKSDGSLQCGMGKTIAIEDMKKELKGIKVYSQSNQNDGLMRIQVCGAPTGQAHVFEISEEDLAKALKLGFKQWTFN